MRTLRLACACLAFFALAAPAGAQASDSLARDTARVLPYAVALEIARYYNATAALRATGPVDILADQVVTGAVTVLRGPLNVAGRVTGRVLVVNGDAILKPGSRIEGDLIVVGGRIEGDHRSAVGGQTFRYRAPLRFHEEGAVIVAERDPGEGGAEDTWFNRWRHRRRDSNSRIALLTSGVYNRVEGLPILVGPSLQALNDRGRVRLEAFGIYRSVDGFRGDQRAFGYDVTADVQRGFGRRVLLGARIFDVVDGVEKWQLRDSEVGLASFFLHKDYRDYFARHGGGGFLTASDGAGVDLTLGYTVERWRALEARNPSTLLRNEGVWRPNPLADAGLFHIATAALTVDTRTDPEYPWSGWYIMADVERGSGSGVSPGSLSAIARTPVAAPFGVTYWRGLLDLRRYNRVSPHGQLNVRLVAGGWLAGDDLPTERRLSLGGPGTIPGYDFRGAPSGADVLQCGDGTPYPGEPAQCERIALGQIEYRGDLHLHLAGNGDLTDWIYNIDNAASWVVFADAGRGWLVGNRSGSLRYGGTQLPPLDTFRGDIGVGLDFGFLGFFVAKSVTDSQEPANFFMRLKHRF